MFPDFGEESIISDADVLELTPGNLTIIKSLLDFIEMGLCALII